MVDKTEGQDSAVAIAEMLKKMSREELMNTVVDMFGKLGLMNMQAKGLQDEITELNIQLNDMDEFNQNQVKRVEGAEKALEVSLSCNKALASELGALKGDDNVVPGDEASGD